MFTIIDNGDYLSEGGGPSPPAVEVAFAPERKLGCWIPQEYTVADAYSQQPRCFRLTRSLSKEGAFSNVYAAAEIIDNQMTEQQYAIKIQKYAAPGKECKPLLPHEARPVFQGIGFQASPYVYNGDANDKELDNISESEKQERVRCFQEIDIMKRLRLKNTDVFSQYFTELEAYQEIWLPIEPQAQAASLSDSQKPKRFIIRALLIVMNLCADSLNEQIKKHLSQGTTFPMHQRIKCALQCAQALSIMHQSGCYHRDLKASNILNDNGMYKICDFGISTTDGSQTARQTSSSRAISTCHLGSNNEEDIRTDVSTWGFLLFQAITLETDENFNQRHKDFFTENPKRPNETKVEADRRFLSFLEPQLENAAKPYPGLTEVIRECIRVLDNPRPNCVMFQSSVYLTWRAVLEPNSEVPAELNIQGLLTFMAGQDDIDTKIFDRLLSLLQTLIQTNKLAFNGLLEQPSIMPNLLQIVFKRFTAVELENRQQAPPKTQSPGRDDFDKRRGQGPKSHLFHHLAPALDYKPLHKVLLHLKPFSPQCPIQL